MTTGVVPFTSFAFQATGEPTARTMPDRLAEVKNVVDFGADPTTGNDSTQAVQNAINWTTGPNRGTIYFPPGGYKITRSILLNYDPVPGQPGLSICFRGEGPASQLVAQSWTGGAFLLDRSLATPNNTASVIMEKLAFNGSGPTSGMMVRLGSCSLIELRDILNLTFSSEDSPGNSSQNILIENCTTFGCIVGGSGCILGCNCKDADVGFRLYGKGIYVAGCRVENSNTAYVLGLDSGTAATLTGCTLSGNTLTIGAVTSGTVKIGQRLAGANIPNGISINAGSGLTWTTSNPQVAITTPQAMTTVGNDQGLSGFSIVSCTNEGDWNALDFAGTCSGFYVASFSHQGHDGTNAGASPSLNEGSFTGTVSAGVLTATGISGVIAPGQLLHGAGVPINCYIISGSGGTWNLSNSGFSAGPEAMTSTNQGTQYGIVVRANSASQASTTDGHFRALGLGSEMEVTALQIDTQPSRANLFFDACNAAVGGGGGTAWGLPANAYTAQFEGCNIDPIWTFSQLPTVGGGNDQEGDQFSISDSTTNTWGANVTVGGGGDRVLVRNNGTNYTVVAK